MHIFYLMGKSAVGKDTVYQKLLLRFPMFIRRDRSGREKKREENITLSGKNSFCASGRAVE